MKQIALIMMLLTAPAWGREVFHEAKIEKIILDGENYSGCMVYMNPNMSAGLNCRSDFVSLDCDGAVVNSKTHAKSMLDMAQLAFLLEKQVRLKISDAALTADGFCTANYIRIDK